jgi:hypothetical protein
MKYERAWTRRFLREWRPLKPAIRFTKVWTIPWQDYVDSQGASPYSPRMAKKPIPEAVRKQFAEWGRQGGLAGSRANKVKAAKIKHEKRRQKERNTNGVPDGVYMGQNGREIVFNGVRLTVAKWSRRLRISARTIRGRIQSNLPVDQILKK